MAKKTFTNPIEVGAMDKNKLYAVGISDDAGFEDLLVAVAPSLEQAKSKTPILLARLSKFSLGDLSIDKEKVNKLLSS